ncbi:MAG: pseudoazurin [Pseudomonadota bacterium]
MLKSVDRRTVVIGMAALAASNQFAFAQTTHNVEMLNKHPEDKKRRMVFHPLIHVVEPGDTVKFQPVDKGHNTVSIDGMLPDGVEPWKSKINQEFDLVVEKPGVYGYLCQPHATLGMVGLIIVKGEGMTDNLEAAQAVKQRGRAKKVWKEIWATVEQENLLSA